MKYLSALYLLILLLCCGLQAGAAIPCDEIRGREQTVMPCKRADKKAGAQLSAQHDRRYERQPFHEQGPDIIFESHGLNAGLYLPKPVEKYIHGPSGSNHLYPIAGAVSRGPTAVEATAIHAITRLLIFPVHLFW